MVSRERGTGSTQRPIIKLDNQAIASATRARWRINRRAGSAGDRGDAVASYYISCRPDGTGLCQRDQRRRAIAPNGQRVGNTGSQMPTTGLSVSMPTPDRHRRHPGRPRERGQQSRTSRAFVPVAAKRGNVARRRHHAARRWNGASPQPADHGRCRRRPIPPDQPPPPARERPPGRARS